MVSDTYVRTRQRVSNLQVVLPLIEENMVADQSWRHWLGELALGNPPEMHRVMIPVALDATAYNMPAALREMNYLRPTGLPLSEPTAGKAFENVVRSLLKQITEAMCRVMLPRPAISSAGAAPLPDAPLPKVNVFLSHAKQDGTEPARRLRDYIYSQTQLTAFFDENDIAFGSKFSRVIQSGLSASDTAAFIAVRSAAYGSRPWCRRESSLFRRPHLLENSVAGQAERWFVYPSVVVEAMKAGTSSIGVSEFGNSTLIRWADDVANLEELIVTTVIRDAMLASFHSALGSSIPSNANQIIINTLPDPTTLLHIPRIRAGAPHDLLYPGRGLSGLELAILSDLFPALTFRSFEEALL